MILGRGTHTIHPSPRGVFRKIRSFKHLHRCLVAVAMFPNRSLLTPACLCLPRGERARSDHDRHLNQSISQMYLYCLSACNCVAGQAPYPAASSNVHNNKPKPDYTISIRLLLLLPVVFLPSLSSLCSSSSPKVPNEPENGDATVVAVVG
jgi:hypothetical protein